MKLKYYLRGLGIGIAVTAFIMSRSMKTEELTDAQIKLRALELGMVEETVLAQLPQAAPEEEDNSLKEDKTEKTSNNEKEDNEGNVFDYTAGEADIIEKDENGNNLEQNESVETTNNMAAENDVDEQITQREENLKTEIEEEMTGQQIAQNTKEEIVESYIVIAVEPGNGSETISRRLYNAGLVESAVQFNRFLVDNGYDRNLIVGNHEIPVGATEEDMAKILCGLQ